MRISLVLFLLLFGPVVFGQTSLFKAKAIEQLEALDVTYPIDESRPIDEEYDFLVEGMDDLENLFLSAVKKSSKNRPDELEQSQTLSSLSSLATQYWRGSQYANTKKWTKLSILIKQAARRSTCHFSIIKSLSFRITLVNNHGRRFYHDRKGPEGQLNLYMGNRPSVLENEEDIELEPVTFHHEDYLVAEFLRKIRKKSMLSELRRGVYAYVGISVQIDEKTLNRKKLPTARIVILLGARRLQKLKI
ncbi:MAG: hypothetical protein QNK23_09570 [Crocinitomicaceae bacterium]|nr:hypothetical protein [Crocinitomicaceae bacterium]